MSFDPTLKKTLLAKEPLVWLNPEYLPGPVTRGPGRAQVTLAENRMKEAAALLKRVFPEVVGLEHGIESSLDPAGRLTVLHDCADIDSGTWFLKRDDSLPVAGSVKARGGFHEVLALAEKIALAHQIHLDGGLLSLASPEARSLFSNHTIAVGSTGNLGMGIGLLAAALGFRPIVHMSVEAKRWKKELLRDHGAEVIEHAGDYAAAVSAGRAQSAPDQRSLFIDDERSLMLFLGYAAGARHLVQQLKEAGQQVDAEHPLFVYIPCGVGGAPGGITYGLKLLLGENVHCFFVEPVASPCMLVQLASGSDAPVSVRDIRLDPHTEADGLAVSLASEKVAPLMRTLLSGIVTVSDDDLYRNLFAVHQIINAKLEPSAAAVLSGPVSLLSSNLGKRYIRALGVPSSAITHVLWSTGGSLVPDEEYAAFLENGRCLSERRELELRLQASKGTGASKRIP